MDETATEKRHSSYSRILAALLLLFTFYLFVIDAYQRVLLDFSYFFEAGTRMAAGRDIYLEPYHKLDRDGSVKELYYFYPPLLAYALSFFAALRFDTAKLLWCSLNYGAFVLSAVFLTDLWKHFSLPVRTVYRLPIVLFFFTCFEPLYWAVSLGQVDVLVMCFLISFLWLISKGSKLGAGTALGIAVLLKISPGLLFFPLIWRKEWRVLLASLSIAGLFCLLLLAGATAPATYVNFPEALRQVSSGNLTAWYGDNLSLDKALSQIFGAWVWEFRFLVKGLLLLLGLVILRAFGPSKQSGLRCYAVFMVLMIGLSPAIWFQHFVWAIPALFFVLVDAPVSRRAKDALPRHLTASIGIYFLITQLQLLRVTVREVSPHWLPLVSLLPTFALLWLVLRVIQLEPDQREAADG